MPDSSQMNAGIDHLAPWMQTERRHVDMLRPTAEMMNLDDICTALGRLVRFTGHGARPWTIAQHSVVVGALARHAGMDDRTTRCALLHDATEAYVGDVNRPLKQAMRLVEGTSRSTFDVIEGRFWSAIADRFDLPDVMPNEVIHLDNVALALEANDLFGAGTAERWSLPGPPSRFDLWRVMPSIEDGGRSLRRAVGATGWSDDAP